MKRSTPLKRKSPMSRGSGLKRSPLKKVSDKRKKELALYSKRKKEYFKDLAEKQGRDFPLCEICGKEEATDWHHVLPLGRGGKLNQPEELMLATGFRCHRWIHDNPREAKENGWLV